MNRDISEKMENLTPEQLEALGRLINKFDRQNSEKTVDEPDSHGRVKPQKGREKPRSKIVLSENEKVETKQVAKRNPRGRAEPRSQSNRRDKVRRPPGKRQKAGTTLARTESVRLSGENKFSKMRERNTHKDDTKIDKLLWKDREPEERPEEFGGYVEVQCSECNLFYDVHPSLVYNDPENGATYTCDNCASSFAKE